MLTAVEFALLVEALTWIFAGAIAGAVAGLVFARLMFWRPIPERELAADIEADQRFRNSEGQL